MIIVGIPSNGTSADLIKIVKPFGNPLSANVAVDADGNGRGFGFVQFGDSDAQAAAIKALDKTVVEGRTLNVRAVEERTVSTAKASNARSRPCFDFAKGRCTKGAACKWAHVAPAVDEGGEASRRPEWQKKRPVGTGVQALDSVPEDVCRKYQLGSCHRGAACRWKHVIVKVEASGSGGGAAVSAAPSVKRARTAEHTGMAAGPTAVGRAGSSASAAEATRIGGSVAAPTLDELRARLKAREEIWRKANKSHPNDAAVPEEVKNRDVVWRSLERRVQRGEEDEAAA